jgi:23S rRNA pseudouridine1911/1915/1917 synthase
LFSDATYGGDSIQKGMNFSKFSKFMENCFGIMPRQALHAFSLGFVHPKTNENVYFEQALPPDFQGLLDKLDHYIQYNIATI